MIELLALADARDRLRFAREVIEDNPDADAEVVWRAEVTWKELLALIARAEYVAFAAVSEDPAA